MPSSISIAFVVSALCLRTVEGERRVGSVAESQLALLKLVESANADSSMSPGVKKSMEELVMKFEDDVETQIVKFHGETQSALNTALAKLTAAASDVVNKKGLADVADVSWVSCIAEEKAQQEVVEDTEALRADTIRDEQQVFCGLELSLRHVTDDLISTGFACTAEQCRNTLDSHLADLDERFNTTLLKVEKAAKEHTSADAQCTEAQEYVVLLEQYVDDNRTEWHDKRKACQGLDTKRQVATCEFGVALQSKCKVQAEYQELLAKVTQDGGGIYSETDRVNEWQTTQRMICELRAFINDEEEATEESKLKCVSANSYASKVGTVDTHVEALADLTSEAKFTCDQDTFAFSGRSWVVPKGKNVASSQYESIQNFTLEVNLDVGAEPLDMCSSHTFSCVGQELICPGASRLLPENECMGACTARDCCALPTCAQESDSAWIKVYQIKGGINTGTFTLNTGTVGNIAELGVSHNAKLSDEHINTLAKPKDGFSHLYMMHSAQTYGKTYVRTNNPYQDLKKNFGAEDDKVKARVCLATGYSQCDTWATLHPEYGMDNYNTAPRLDKFGDCARFLTSYGKDADCWFEKGTRCVCGGYLCNGFRQGSEKAFNPLAEFSLWLHVGPTCPTDTVLSCKAFSCPLGFARHLNTKCTSSVCTQTECCSAPKCVTDSGKKWVKVYQFLGTAAVPDFKFSQGAVGDVSEAEVTHNAKLPDAVINDLAQPIDGFQMVYMMRSAKTSRSNFVRSSSTYVDYKRSFGLGSDAKVCLANSMDECNQWASFDAEKGGLDNAATNPPLDTDAAGKPLDDCERFVFSSCWGGNGKKYRRCIKGGAKCGGDNGLLSQFTLWVHVGDRCPA